MLRGSVSSFDDSETDYNTIASEDRLYNAPKYPSSPVQSFRRIDDVERVDSLLCDLDWKVDTPPEELDDISTNDTDIEGTVGQHHQQEIRNKKHEDENEEAEIEEKNNYDENLSEESYLSVETMEHSLSISTELSFAIEKTLKTVYNPSDSEILKLGDDIAKRILETCISDVVESFGYS